MTDARVNDSRRRIPSVDLLLQSDVFADLIDERPRSLVVKALRRVLDETRRQLAVGEVNAAPDTAVLAERTRQTLDAMDVPSLRRVINATGIPLHTNLGRAPLPSAVREALNEVSAGYTNLEYDLEEGARGSRHQHCAAMLMELTGAGGALIVNNNAAAVVLAVDEFAGGREVVVSRGELVEIGGSFRVPDIVAKSGARIVEVGTTNRTHARDYAEAIGPETGALLKVHRSNFQQSGFVAEVDIGELAEIAHERDLPVIHDLGSGLLPEAESLGLPWEPSVRASLRAGADIVTFSGDKLLGGPQAGVIVGRGELIDRIRSNPLLRALRVGKLTIAALEATLRLWRDESTARSDVPAMAMISADSVPLRRRAERIADALRGGSPGAEIEVAQDVTEIGGGSYPGAQLETWVLRIQIAGRSERDLEAACRAGDPPVIGRVRGDALVLDPRTVLSSEEEVFIERVAEVLRKDG